jgi:hypothetical protein
MKIEATDAIALKAVIKSDISALQRINTALTDLADREWSDAEAVSAAYHLHNAYNAYNALENSSDQVSRTFENHVKDPARWHQELLRKMFLDLTPLRPSLLDGISRPLLEDLCAFRHLFRHSYSSGLDSDRVRQLAHKWLKGNRCVLDSLAQFAELLARSGQSS